MRIICPLWCQPKHFSFYFILKIDFIYYFIYIYVQGFRPPRADKISLRILNYYLSMTLGSLLGLQLKLHAVVLSSYSLLAKRTSAVGRIDPSKKEY